MHARRRRSPSLRAQRVSYRQLAEGGGSARSRARNVRPQAWTSRGQQQRDQVKSRRASSPVVRSFRPGRPCATPAAAANVSSRRSISAPPSSLFTTTTTTTALFSAPVCCRHAHILIYTLPPSCRAPQQNERPGLPSRLPSPCRLLPRISRLSFHRRGSSQPEQPHSSSLRAPGRLACFALNPVAGLPQHHLYPPQCAQKTQRVIHLPYRQNLQKSAYCYSRPHRCCSSREHSSLHLHGALVCETDAHDIAPRVRFCLPSPVRLLRAAAPSSPSRALLKTTATCFDARRGIRRANACHHGQLNRPVGQQLQRLCKCASNARPRSVC